MRIAVVQHVSAGYYAEYISSLIDEAALQHNYQVVTFSNSIPVFKQLIAENAVVYIITETTSAISLKWWYAFKLPSILKKLKAGVVVDLNGIASSTKINQVTCIDQSLAFAKPLLNMVHKLSVDGLQRTISSSKTIITCSQTQADLIIEKGATKASAQLIKCTAPGNFKKYEWHEKIMIKATQADNNDYFFAVLNDDDEAGFTLLLRAFTKFKKWQQSSMKLLLLPRLQLFNENIRTKHQTYKYRDDVKLLEDLPEIELVSVIASAHSMVNITGGNADLMVLAIALQCALPVIILKNKETEEYLADAALYIHDETEESIGNALISLYKNENVQAQLKLDAEKQSQTLNRETVRAALWQLLQTTATQNS